jgi:aspartate-semialdehyde dehydrogenase
VSYEPVVAIAGVTGAVGAEFIATMDRRAFPVRKLKALASARSAGKTIDFRGERIVIESSPKSRSRASTSRCSRQAPAPRGSSRPQPSRPVRS